MAEDIFEMIAESDCPPFIGTDGSTKDGRTVGSVVLYISTEHSSHDKSLDELKMVGIIISFAAAIHTCWRDNINVDDFPVLLNACDGLSANGWVNYRCKTSMAGRAFGCLFVAFS